MTFLLPTSSASGRSARQRAISRSVSLLPSTDVMLDNVLTALANATPDECKEGLGWYPQANSHAVELAEAYGLTVSQGAGVIAALSPQTGWGENIRLAHEACIDAAQGLSASGHFDDACQKVDLIMSGADPADVLGGRKVRSFYANILRPLQAGPVTVDRHAIALLCGAPLDPLDRSLERVGVYQRGASVFRTVARRCDLLGHEVQAICWIHWRNLTGANLYDGEQF